MCLSLYVSALLNSCISHTTHEQLWITLLRKTTHPVSPKVNYPEKWEHQQIINAFQILLEHTLPRANKYPNSTTNKNHFLSYHAKQ